MSELNNTNFTANVNILSSIFSTNLEYFIPKIKLFEKIKTSMYPQYGCAMNLNSNFAIKKRNAPEPKIDHDKLYELTVGFLRDVVPEEELDEEAEALISCIGNSNYARVFFEIMGDEQEKNVDKFKIVRCMQHAHEHVRILSMLNECNKKINFSEFKKGTCRYYIKQQNELLDFMRWLTTRDYETFALTLTYDMAKWGRCRPRAWKTYTKHIHAVLEYFRKHYGMRYCWVKESTYRGYPHVHCVLAFPNGTIQGYEKMKNQQHIIFGWLYNEIKKRSPSREIHLEAIKGNYTSWYLSKYITNFSQAGIDKILQYDTGKSKTFTKLYLAYIYTTMTGTRICGHSVLSKEEKEECFNEAEKRREEWNAKKNGENAGRNDNNGCCSGVFNGSEHDFTRAGVGTVGTFRGLESVCGIGARKRIAVSGKSDDGAERNNRLVEQMEDRLINLIGKPVSQEVLKNMAHEVRLYLIRLCNNSPFSCSKEIRSVKLVNAPPEWRVLGTDCCETSTESDERLWNCSRRITCHGCLYSEVYNFIKTGESKYINLNVYHLGKTVELKPLFETEEKIEDYEWLCKLTWVIYYYRTMISEYGFTLNQARVFFETFDNVCDDDWLATGFQKEGYKGLFELLRSS